MFRSRSERQLLARDFAADIARMRACLEAAGRRLATDDELVRAWTSHSDASCAVWLCLPDDDAFLLGILDDHLPPTYRTGDSPHTWRARIEDAGDGSGDGIIVLPEELMVQLGWKIGDELSITEDGHRQLMLRRVE
ncbi:MAG TPA: AbrB/MazE/SpoVT family DNA-binding domain-containing protein [Noviherbaspirillum sp.]|nr:AbrB/MazE/SpoVT family DNA-binding domain-containing protein [Noviherbaspirillum sp.]